MKKLIVIVCMLLFVSLAGNSEPRRLGAYLSHAAFNIPGDSPYLETYLEILGNTIVYKQNPSGKFQGNVQITMIIRQDSTIKDFRKYELLSPEISDTATVGINFIDQQRFSLPNGIYALDLSITDLNSDVKPVVITYPIEINFPTDNFSMSGIQLINSYSRTSEPNMLSKSGYDFVPFVDNFFSSDRKTLSFYTEIYNPAYKNESQDKFLVSAFIESYETKKMLNQYIRIKKEISKPVIVLLSDFDITDLPSGNYNLVINLRNSENKIIAENAIFFQRSNPGVGRPALDLASVNMTGSFADRISDADSLREFIRSLRPLATELEAIFIKSQVQTASPEVLKQFFLNFWQTRDELNPEKAWQNYKYEVIKVNSSYSTQTKKGYETDMGRVYLQYGQPNTITDVPFETAGYLYSLDNNNKVSGNTGSIPYQIWHYYSLNNNRERNRKFVFLSSELGVRDYTLVHSDATGEIPNYNWQSLLHRGAYESEHDADRIKRDQTRSATYYNNPF